MDHAITIGNVLVVCGVALGVVMVIGGLILLVSIMNPFRSGH